METRSLTLLAVLAALTAGFGAGFVVGDGGPVEDSALPQRTAGSDRGSARASDAPLAPTGALPRPSAPTTPSAEEVMAQARRSVSASPAPDDPTGDGVIRGRVVGVDGEPIGSATVVAIWRSTPARGEVDLRTSGDLGRGWNDGAERARSLETYVRQRLEGDRRRRVVASAADGSFALDGLEERSHSVRAFLEGFDADWEVAEPGDDLTIVLNAVGVFVLDPRLPDGSQPDEAAILVQGSRSRPTPYRWSKDQPSVRLAGGSARISMASTDLVQSSRNEYMASHVAAERIIDLERDGAGPHRFDLVATVGLTVTLEVQGLVTRDRSHEVEVRALGSESWVELERVEARVFATTDLETGAHVVRVRRSGGASLDGTDATLAEETVQLEPGLNEAALTVEGADEDAFLVVTCVDESGRAITCDRISYMSEYPSGGASGSVRPLIRPGGEHWIEWSSLENDQSDVTKVTLTLSHEIHGSVTRVVEPGTKRVEVVMRTPCGVTVEVRGLEDGAQTKVTLVPMEEKPDGEVAPATYNAPSEEVPPAGVVTFDAVQPGTYQVRLEPRGFTMGRAVFARETVRVSGASMTVQLDAPPLHLVEIVAPAAHPGSQVALQRDGDSAQSFNLSSQTDDDDVARFEDVPAGRYRVRVWTGDGTSEMLITVPCGRVPFAASEITGYEITNVRDDTLAAEMGFQVGDVLVGSTEERIDSESAMARVFAKALDAPVTLVVERDGREVRLTLPVAEDGAPYQDIGVWTKARLR